MARFRISARPATFCAAGDHKMVSVAAMVAPLASEIVDCKSVADLRARIAGLAATVRREHPAASFSMGQRLIDGRAPAGYRGTYFGLDYDATDQTTMGA